MIRTTLTKTTPQHSSIYVFSALTIVCLSSLIPPPVALLMGILYAQFFEHPFPAANHRLTNSLLKAAIIGLGLDMNIFKTLETGQQGLLLTLTCIVAVFVMGKILRRIFNTDPVTSFLISCGTAICGGSAIAAVSAVCNAEERQVSMALGAVFLLNAIALVLFPVLGKALHLSQTEFGLWSATAIHDTSSVIGAASTYGPQALEVATTVKLARVLWIIPIAGATALYNNNKQRQVYIPWFIVLFILASLFNTFFQVPASVAKGVSTLSHTILSLSIFLTCSTLSLSSLKKAGWKSLMSAVILWVMVSGLSLFFILMSR